MTKPTNTPIDTTRRHLLTIAAGGAVAAAIPADALTAAPAIDPIYAAIEAHRKAAAVEQAAWAEVNGRPDLSIDDECALTDAKNAEASDALDELAETVPTTLPGLLAMIVYASEANDVIPEAFDICQQSLVTAAEALMGGRVS